MTPRRRLTTHGSPKGIGGWIPGASTPSSTRTPASSTGASSSTRPSTTTEMEKIFGRAWLMVGHESLVPRGQRLLPLLHGRGPGDRHPRRPGPDPRAPEHVPPPRQPRRRAAMTATPGASCAPTTAGPSRTTAPQARRRASPRPTTARSTSRRWASSRPGSTRTPASSSPPGPQDAPSLEAYLGDARWYLDTVFNRRDGGMMALGPQKWIEPVNWKTPVDNCSDNYHVPITHFSSAMVQSRYPRPAAALAQGRSSRARTSTSSSTATPSPSGMRERRHAQVRARHVAGHRSSSSRSTTTPPSPRSSGGSARSARARSSSATTASSRTACSASGWRCRAARSRPSSGTSCWSRRTRPEAIKQRDPDREPGEQRRRRAVRAGRHRQLAPGDGGEHEPPRPPVRPGSLDGARPCRPRTTTTRAWCPSATSPRTTSGISTCAGRSS